MPSGADILIKFWIASLIARNDVNRCYSRHSCMCKVFERVTSIYFSCYSESIINIMNRLRIVVRSDIYRDSCFSKIATTLVVILRSRAGYLPRHHKHLRTYKFALLITFIYFNNSSSNRLK